MITVEDIKAREQRLGELIRGLMKERAIIREAEDPLLYLERRHYITNLGNAIAGLETARVTLNQCLTRIKHAAKPDAA